MDENNGKIKSFKESLFDAEKQIDELLEINHNLVNANDVKKGLINRLEDLRDKLNVKIHALETTEKEQSKDLSRAELGNRLLEGDIEILSLELEESEKEKEQYCNEIQSLLKIIQSLNSNISAMASILKKEK